MPLPVEKFVCTRCGTCCTRLVSDAPQQQLPAGIVTLNRPTLVLEQWEAKPLAARLMERGLAVEVVPCRALVDEQHRTLIVLDYTLTADACPFHDEGGCSIYRHRPLTCRRFPCAYAPSELRSGRFVFRKNVACPAERKDGSLKAYLVAQRRTGADIREAFLARYGESLELCESYEEYAAEVFAFVNGLVASGNASPPKGAVKRKAVEKYAHVSAVELMEAAGQQPARRFS